MMMISKNQNFDIWRCRIKGRKPEYKRKKKKNSTKLEFNRQQQQQQQKSTFDDVNVDDNDDNGRAKTIKKRSKFQ